MTRQESNHTAKFPPVLGLAFLVALLAAGCGGEVPSEAAGDSPPPSVERVDTGTGPESVYGIDEVVPAAVVQETAMDVEETPVGVPAVDDTAQRVDPYGEGTRLFEERHYLEAATHLSVASREEPDSWYVHYLLGLSL